MAQQVKNLPAIQEMWNRSLGWEDPLEEGMAKPIQYSCLGNPMDKEDGVLWSMGSQRVEHNLSNCTHTHARTHTQVHCRMFTSILRPLQTRWQSHYSSCNNQKHFQGTANDFLWNKITFGWKPCIKTGRSIKILSTYWEITKFNYRFSNWDLVHSLFYHLLISFHSAP